jgi:hypothetical protein|tara:strand:+ start:481 stop:666 length:186 start_codon:yes stop_codon:yes gene_type:complete
MAYFWKNKFIPKELQEHINKTLRQVRANKIPNMHPIGEVKDFINKAGTILSGSESTKTNEK